MKKSETVEEYISMSERFTWLVDTALKKIEQAAKNGDLHTVAMRLPGLISIVNVVGYLRGQDGFFIDERPDGLAGDYQKQLYATEDEVERRLWLLIDLISENPESREEYLMYMRTYYLQARTPQKYR